MSARRVRSNQRVLLAGRRTTLALTVAVLGFGTGTALAEGADEVPTPTDTQVATEESLVVELVVEAPPEPVAAQALDGQPDGDASPVIIPATSAPAPSPDSLTEPAPDIEPAVAAAPETTTTTEPTEADGNPEDGGGGHEDGGGGHQDGEDGHEDGEDGHEDGEDGHEGSGGGGQGTPYSMTFSVDWRSEAGTPVAVLGDVLPADWRTLFELTAASRTGRNRPTSAVCTYADSGDQLACEFENPGHRSEAEGLIVPARPTATYTVDVAWVVAGWTIDGANAGPYSARDLCPRGGHGTGHDGGHEGGHGSGHQGGHDSSHGALAEGVDAAPGGGTFPCEHVVVIQQLPAVTPEPQPEPEPPVEPEPPAEPAAPDTDEAGAALSPIASASTATPHALPATGSSISVMLAIGTALAAIGAGLALLARRTTPDPTGTPVGDRARMAA